MSTWTHGTTTITFDAERATFRADGPNGEKLRAPSLAAIKKQLDGLNTVAFKPFAILRFTLTRFNAWSTEAEAELGKFTTGLKAAQLEKESTGRSGMSYRFVIEGQRNYGSSREYSVYPDSPENREAVSAYMALVHENALKRKAMDDAESELEKRILVIHAKDYAAGKREPVRKGSGE
jgi:hypothetical protein